MAIIAKRGSLSARDVPLELVTIDKLQKLLNKTARVNECWLYVNAHHTGYSYVRLGEFKYPAHRVIKAVTLGRNFPGLVTDHLCRNRGCIRPRHLEVVTTGENTRRGQAWLYLPQRHRTHCVNGHPFDEKNTYRPGAHVKSHKRRICRECHKLTERRRRERLQNAQ